MSKKLLKFNKVKAVPKGFTLMELLVSMAIFSVVAVLMSNIVLTIAAFSLDNERRTDFLFELDGVGNTIKNDLRSSQTVGSCKLDASDTVFFKDPIPVSGINLFYALEKVSKVVSGQTVNQLQWTNIQTPAGTPSVCSRTTAIPVPSPKLVSSPTVMNISDFKISISYDNALSPTNSLLFVMIDSCDPTNPSVKKAIFACPVSGIAGNPYRYEIAINTRGVIK